MSRIYFLNWRFIFYPLIFLIVQLFWSNAPPLFFVRPVFRIRTYFDPFEVTIFIIYVLWIVGLFMLLFILVHINVGTRFAFLVNFIYSIRTLAPFPLQLLFTRLHSIAQPFQILILSLPNVLRIVFSIISIKVFLIF